MSFAVTLAPSAPSAPDALAVSSASAVCSSGSGGASSSPPPNMTVRISPRYFAQDSWH